MVRSEELSILLLLALEKSCWEASNGEETNNQTFRNNIVTNANAKSSFARTNNWVPPPHDLDFVLAVGCATFTMVDGLRVFCGVSQVVSESADRDQYAHRGRGCYLVLLMVEARCSKRHFFLYRAWRAGAHWGPPHTEVDTDSWCILIGDGNAILNS